MMAADDAELPVFGRWAALYQRYRPRYPLGLYQLLAAQTPEHRLCVELGAGSGQATVDLLTRFDRVCAIEPDPQMARLLPADPRLEVQVAFAETAQGACAADAVVAATAFHWMDQPCVAQRAARWLKPGGVVFVFGYAAAQYPGAPAAVTELAMSYARAWRSHVHERLTSWRPYEQALEESGAFVSVETFELYSEFHWPPSEMAGFLASTSYGQAYAQATGDPDAALTRLTHDLDRAAGGREIAIRFPIEGAIARTPGV